MKKKVRKKERKKERERRKKACTMEEHQDSQPAGVLPPRTQLFLHCFWGF
jgi:hypothetical protein